MLIFPRNEISSLQHYTRHSQPLYSGSQFHFLWTCLALKWVTSYPLIVFLVFNSVFKGEGNGTPLQCSCLENPMDGGAWWAAVHGVAEGRTRLSDFTFTFHFHALEKEMATQSSVLAWRIPGTGEPGGLPSMGSHRVGHDWSDSAVCLKQTCYTNGESFKPKIPWKQFYLNPLDDLPASAIPLTPPLSEAL